MRVLFDRDDPDLTDEGTAKVLEAIKAVAGGPRVRILAAYCSACGEDMLPEVSGAIIRTAEPDVVIELDNEQIKQLRLLGAFDAGVAEGVPCTVAADVVRILSQQWHTDDCPGPLLFETEPLEGGAERV